MTAATSMQSQSTTTRPNRSRARGKATAVAHARPHDGAERQVKNDLGHKEKGYITSRLAGPDRRLSRQS